MGNLQQTVFIENRIDENHKELIEEKKISITDFPNFIAQYKEAENIFLFGPVIFLKKIEQQTREKELLKYNKIKTKFHYMKG